jgi:hypothetical protein
MNNAITTNIGDRLLAMRNAAAANGGQLRFPRWGVKLTGKIPTGQTVTLPVLAFGTVWGKLQVDLPGGYSSYWDELTPEEKESILDFAETNLAYPNDPEGTLEERFAIRCMNQRFIGRHGDLSEEDFKKMEYVRKVIEAARTDEPAPLPGDTVEGAYYGGKCPFRKGMLDTPHPWYGPGGVDLCAGPYSPFVSLTEQCPEGYAFSMSGGPFFKIATDDLEYLGKDRRVFTVWGHNGPCADGSIVFEAEVNRWKLKEGTDI